MLVFRTLVHARAGTGPIRIGAELEDSRQELADTGTPINTTIVNSAELLRAYLRWNSDSLVGTGIRSDLSLGRITMDVGSRRLVARNRYRNTINGFTGADWRLTLTDGSALRLFYVLPVLRRPVLPARLRDNEAEFDEEDGDIRFWGIVHERRGLSFGSRGEFYLLGLHEDDSADRRTRDRELLTAGFRLLRRPAAGEWDYQLENAVQFGTSRPSLLARSAEDHFAHFHHFALGYSFERPWRPRLAFQFDYASGDDDPDDGDNNRFDTLFGARRFEWGPTGIYGPFARSNLVTPGLRLQLKPSPKLSGFVAWRAYWLASDQDAWTTALLRDGTGDSGSYLGHQVEARVRYDLLPKNLRVEAGFAHIFEGEFAEDAPRANDNGDPTYLYAQAVFTF